MGIFATVNPPSAIHSKSTDNRKSIMSFKEGAADDREEGEIIDEYEDIISSDEEFSMRLRIEELEAKNAELEKIANISAIYASGSYDYTKKDSTNHHVDRYPLISIDISDEEVYPPPPSMTRITKRRKSLQHSSSRRKMIHTTTNGGHRRRKKSSSPPPPPPYRPSDKLLLSMFHEKYAARSSSKKRRKSKKSHSTKPTRKAREYHYGSDDYTLDTYNLDVEDGYENYKSSDAEASFSINRDELRLALARNTYRHEQHISLKDRLIRRKENTDTLNEKNVNDVQEIVELDDNSDGPRGNPDAEDNMEEQELRIIALKSAVIRKHLVRKKRNENVAYSPSDFDEAYANVSVSPSINIDEAEPCMEISPVPSPKIVVSDDDLIDTKPVDMDIVNSDSDCELSYEKWVPIQQIPLPNSLMMQNELYVPTPLRYNTNVEHPHFMPPDVKFETALDSPVNLDSDVEEEELALRTLLLAKMNSPKVNKNVIEERPKIEERHSPDADISLEAEALRDFLISNMKKKSQPQNSSASVLKEAVRRLTARNVNSSPNENFVEFSPIQDTCQSVSAFSMTLHEAENQLSRSTADLAKIQIGQPGIRVKNVRQGWALCKSDEECNDVKFIPSSEVTKADSNYPTQSNKKECDVESSPFKGTEEGVLHEEVDPRENRNLEIQTESEGLYAKVCTSKKADDVLTEYDIQTISLVKCVPTQDCKTLKVDPKESSVATTEKENKADINLNLTGCVADEETNKNKPTIECQGKSVSEVNKSDAENPKTDSSVTSPTEIVLSDVVLIKDRSIEPIDNSENNLTEIKKDTQHIANQTHKSSATNSEVTVEINEIKESSTPQQSKVELSDTRVKTGVKSVSLDVIKSLGVVNQYNIVSAEFKSASVPIQKKSTKKSSGLNVCKVEKTLTTASKHAIAKENMPMQQQKKDAPCSARINDESSLCVAKGGKENTALTNASATKLQAEVEKTQNPIIEQSFTPKPSHLVLSTHTFHPKSSMHQATKIVKPNKVINTRVSDLKRPLTENIVKSTVPAKLPKLDKPSNRLITTAEMPQVKKLVIQLRASDSESDYSALSADGGDDDDADDLDARDTGFMNRSITIGNEYYDIASPISLPMESPCGTPIRTASPVASVATQPVVEKSIVNDFFEAQLDKFLKNVRSKVFESSNQPVDFEESTPSAVSTPVAVRHLPEASQQEYRRLINRMKMLERQKQSKNLQVIVKNTDPVKSTETRTALGDGESLVRKVLVKNASVSTAAATCQDDKTSQKHALQKPKTPEREKVIPPVADGIQKPKAPEKARQTNSTMVLPNMSLSTQAPSTSSLALPASSPPKTVSSSSKTIPASTTKPGSSTPNQSNQKLLALYEKTYRETGNSIISNLDRSIEMVTVARKAKMEKLKHEHRLMELRKEMEEVQRRMRQHQERITKMYPEICNSHRMIETLKTRRVKIHKDVTAFGKRVIGQSYSMNNDQKSIILEKSKKLAAEIKFVNNMKMSDVEKWKNVTQPLQTDATASVPAPINKPAIENDSHICQANDKEPVDDSKTTAIETSLPEATLRIEPELTHSVVPARNLNEPKKDEDITEQDTDQKKSTNGHEEERPVDNYKKTYNSKDHKEEDENINDREEDGQKNDRGVCENEQMGGIKLQDYVSPLGHMRDKRQINPNGIVCPYQLMGQCGDKDCKYMHLDN